MSPGGGRGRREDARLLTGCGRYAADWSVPCELHAHFLRSDRAHADIHAVNVERALRHPGVLRVFTGQDAVRAGYVDPQLFPMRTGRDGRKAPMTPRPVIAADRVRFVGDPVALVVAETQLVAQDAAELIEVEYRDRECVIGLEQALATSAPQLHDAIPGNLLLDTEAGDAAAVDAAFARATHVTKLKIESTRVVPSPMEPRACLAVYDGSDGTYTLHVPLQGINLMRKQVAGYTGVLEENLRIVARDVGGSFGQRSMAYPEYCALMLAARDTGRPVKWVCTRSEGFLSDTHGRSNLVIAELALDGAGVFLAIRLDWITDAGAYLTRGPGSLIGNAITCMTGVYRIPAAYGRFRVALNNTAPVASYRGAGRPDIAYVIERLVSTAAMDMGIDPAELRRRNFISPDAFPYRTATGSTYEIADLPGLLDKALARGRWDTYAERREESARRGKLRGIGIATVIENTSPGMFPSDEIELSADASGAVGIVSVSQSQGQGHETTLAAIVARTMGLDAERVHLHQSPIDRVLKGNHSGGSRTAVGAGSACHLAARKLIEEGRSRAALALGVEPSQVEYANGVFHSSDGAASVTLAELAGREPLKVIAEGSFGATFPNGCHIAEVEIDPETGMTEIVSYLAVDDCGEIIDHGIVEGQVHGAVVQGAGQVFGEHVVYDRATGQLLSASFSDYTMPRSGLVSDIELVEHPTPSTVSPLGVKGVGESGCTASIPALANAVNDALRAAGVRHLDMPMSASRVWHAMQLSNK